jgi:hypothetical protein
MHLRPPARRGQHAVGKRGQRPHAVATGRAAVTVGVTQVVAHVVLAGVEPLQHLTAHALAQGGLHVRRRLHQLAQKGAEPCELRIQDGADGQFAPHLLAQALRGTVELALRRQHAIGQRQQSGAVGREPHAARGALEQAHAQALLQRFELQADGWLRQVQPLGRARQAALAGHGNEGTQCGVFHGADIS